MHETYVDCINGLGTYACVVITVLGAPVLPLEHNRKATASKVLPTSTALTK